MLEERRSNARHSGERSNKIAIGLAFVTGSESATLCRQQPRLHVRSRALSNKSEQGYQDVAAVFRSLIIFAGPRLSSS